MKQVKRLSVRQKLNRIVLANFYFIIPEVVFLFDCFAKLLKAKVRQLADTKKKLDDMKRQKVEMIKKMKDEAKVAREKEKEARKEIIQMKKTMRQTESLGELEFNRSA